MINKTVAVMEQWRSNGEIRLQFWCMVVSIMINTYAIAKGSFQQYLGVSRNEMSVTECDMNDVVSPAQPWKSIPVEESSEDGWKCESFHWLCAFQIFICNVIWNIFNRDLAPAYIMSIFFLCCGSCGHSFHATLPFASDLRLCVCLSAVFA